MNVLNEAGSCRKTTKLPFLFLYIGILTKELLPYCYVKYVVNVYKWCELSAVGVERVVYCYYLFTLGGHGTSHFT